MDLSSFPPFLNQTFATSFVQEKPALFALKMLFKSLGLITTFLSVASTAADFDSDLSFNMTEHEDHLAKRTSVAGVYYCDQPDWKGNCGWSVASGGRCHNRDRINYGSFGPDHGLTCKMWPHADCKCYWANDYCDKPNGPSTISYPGLSSWTQFQNQYIDIGEWNTWQSYSCYWS